MAIQGIFMVTAIAVGIWALSPLLTATGGLILDARIFAFPVGVAGAITWFFTNGSLKNFMSLIVFANWIYIVLAVTATSGFGPLLFMAIAITISQAICYLHQVNIDRWRHNENAGTERINGTAEHDPSGESGSIDVFEQGDSIKGVRSGVPKS